MLFYAYQSIVRQWRRTLLVVFIVGIASGTYLSLTAALSSFSKLVSTSTEPENVAILPSGGFGERWPEISHISPESLGGLREVNGIARAAGGEPLVSPEILLTSSLDHRGKKVRVTLRGVDKLAFEVHRSVMGAPPNNGIVLGANIRKFLAPVAIGDKLRLGDREWAVVGFFEPRAGQTQYDSEIWAPIEEVMRVRNARDYSLVSVRSASANDARALLKQMNALIDQKRSVALREVRVVPEESLGASSASVLTAFRAMFMVLATLILAVAVLGTLNVLLQGVLRRRRHIALFRAMGYRFTAIAGSLVAEGAAVAFVGSVVGVLMALPLSGMTFVIGSVARPGVTVVSLRFGAEDIVTTILLGTLMGAICSLIPAWYAGRFDVKTELRAE